MVRRINFWIILIVCSFVAVGSGLMLLPKIASSQSDPVTAAWENARAAGSYHFSSDVLQMTIPSANVANVGRSSRTDRLHLSGQTNLLEKRLEMQLWSDTGSVLQNESAAAVRVEDGKTYVRQGASDWQPADNISDGFAPNGDFMSYLAAIRDVQAHPSETRAGITFTRYTFRIDGPTFANYARERMEAVMHQRGELPQNLHLETPAYYRGMTGDGELWVREDATGRFLPLRQILNLNFPEQNNESVYAQIKVDFTRFGIPVANTIATESNPATWISAFANRHFSHIPNPLGLLTIIPTAAAAFLVIFLRKSRRLERVLSLTVIASLLIGPALQTLNTVSFLDAQSAKAAAQEQRQQETNIERNLKSLTTRPQYDPHKNLLTAASFDTAKPINLQSLNLPTSNLQSPVSALQSPAASLQAAALTVADNSTDSDGDGLTDFVETSIGSDMDYFDTDEDSITDTLEVNGFTFAGQQWYPDPFTADSNGDTISDDLEWDPNRNGQPDDTDGDQIPDLFDEDNDGDNVPDRKDLAPFTKSGVLAESTPFQLTIHDLQAGKPTFVDFQVRPTDPKHLWFAFNVLDWPGDSEGQVRDIDGKTYADLAVAQGRNAAANESTGDLKLIPMLEIRITGATTNLPPQSDLVPYNITVNDADTSGNQKVVYVPLTVITDEKSGQRVAFSGRMRYQAAGSWQSPHAVRLVWAVQALLDVPCDPSNTEDVKQGCGSDKYIRNQPRVIQTYHDQWTLTGLNVSEDHGASMAVIYDDPALDTDIHEDDKLWMLAHGLDNAFLSGRDQDNNQQRDVDLTEIARRFDHTSNSIVTDTLRWSITNTLRVETKSYATFDQAVMSTAMSETTRILSNTFSSRWISDNALQPLLMYANELQSRALGLDGVLGGDGYVTLNGSQVVVDMLPTAKPRAPLNTTVGLKWAAYCSPAGSTPGWAICEVDQRWEELERRYAALTNFPGDPADPDVAEGRMIVMQIFNLALVQGIFRMVQTDSRVVSGLYTLESDTSTEQTVRSASGYAKAAAKFIANMTIMKRYTSKIPVLKYLSNKLSSKAKRLVLSGIEKVGNFKQNRLAATGIMLASTAVIGGLALLAYFAQEGDLSAKIGLKVLALSMQLLFTVVDLVLMTRAALKSLGGIMPILSARSEIIGVSRMATAIGTAIVIAIVWGFFIYSMVNNNVSPFSPAFNKALAESIAATIYFIVLAIISATVVGAILVAIVALIDAILTAICELGVDELRNAPGMDGACFTISGAAIKLIAKAIYAFDVMIDSDRNDLVVTGQPTLKLNDPNKGFVSGNSIVVQMPVTTTIVHKDPDPSNWQILFYQWMYSKSNLRSTTFQYTLSQSAKQDLDPDLGDMSNAWQGVSEDHKWVSTPMYRGQVLSPHSPVVWTPQPGINRSSEVFLNIGYELPAYECFTLIIPLPFLIIPVCYDRSLGDHSSSQLDKLQFDIFPSTLDGFMTVASEGDGGLGLNWDPAFRTIADADGDGLLVSARGGLDPNDNAFDTDNDGLADRFELERRQAGSPFSPIQIDTDNDGLTDPQELHFATNPGIADTDNDGLRDGEEVWHRRYNPVTGAPTTIFEGGWNVVISATIPISVHVNSDPLLADSDSDGIDDLAEKQLATHVDLAQRVDKNGRTYHPLVANVPPIAIYPEIGDDDGFVRPGQQLLFTNTVVATAAMAPSVFDVNPSNAYAHFAPPTVLNFDPLTFNTAQTVTTASELTIASLPSSQQVSLGGTVRARLAGGSGPAWVLNPLVIGAPLSGFTTKALGASVATSNPARSDEYMIAAVTSNSTNVGGQGDIWKYNIPSGNASTLDVDNEESLYDENFNQFTVNDLRYLRGNTPPSVACNDAGACLVVWDHADNCNRITINSVTTHSVSDQKGGGVELNIYNRILQQYRAQEWFSTYVQHGGINMPAGQTRGPNSHGFPFSDRFCGSMTVTAEEFDGAEGDPFGRTVIARNTLLATDFINGNIRFTGAGNDLSVNVTIPPKAIHVLTGTLFLPNGTTKSVAFPGSGFAERGHNFRPVVASDGSNFMVASELAIDAASDTTQIMAMRFDSNGTPVGAPLFSQSFARTAPVDTSAVALDLAWVGNQYHLLFDLGKGLDAATSFPIKRFSVAADGSSISAPTDITAARFGHAYPLGVTLAYNPSSGGKLLGYHNLWGGFLNSQTRAWFAFQDASGVITPTFDFNRRNPNAAYNPINRGWLYSAFDSAANQTVIAITDASQARIGEQRGFTGIVPTSSDLACPAPSALPVVDLRFEELPGATTFADSSGLGNHASHLAGTQPPAGLPGAVDANGIAVGNPASDYSLGLQGHGVLFSGPTLYDYSIAFWLKTSSFAYSSLVANSTLGFSVNTFFGKVQFTDNGQTIQSGTINDNRWHYVVISRKRSTGDATIFVDGAVAVDGGVSATRNIGTQGSGSSANTTIGFSPFNGQFDNFQLYQTALPLSTVQAIYNRTLQAYCVATATNATSQVHWAKVTMRQPDYRGGKVTASAGLSFTVDADLPTISLAGMNNGQYLPGDKNTPRIHIIGGNASDATSGVAKVEVEENGTYRLAEGAETWAYPLAVTEGSYTLRSRSTDAVGNVSTPSPLITLIADGTAPQVTLAAQPATIIPTRNNAGQWVIGLNGMISDPVIGANPGSGVTAGSTEVLLESSVENGLPNSWQPVAINGNQWAISYTFASDANQPTGIYMLTVRVSDKVGNQLNRQLATLNLDSAGPQALYQVVEAQRQVISDTVLIGGVVSDTTELNSGVDNLQVSFVPIDQVIPLIDASLLLRFEEPTGAIYFDDGTVYNHDAACATAPTCPSAGIVGRIDNAVHFSGNSRLRIANASSLNFDGDESFGVQAWIKSTTGGRTILHKGDGQRSFTLGINGSGRANFALKDGASTVTVSGGSDLRNGQWHHLAATVDRATNLATLYVDDVAVATQSFSGNLTSNGDLTIGGMTGNPGQNFVGEIDQVAIVAHAWVAGEVHDLYAAADQSWHSANLGQVSSFAAASPSAKAAPNALAAANTDSWNLNVPAGLEGDYQIDLRSEDTLGNQSYTSNAWRGVIDTAAPRVAIAGDTTGASYFDPLLGVRRYAITYVCAAYDDHLDETTFVCPGSDIVPAVRSFEKDPTLQRLFPDWTVRSGLVLSYTVWQTDKAPNAKVSACDVFGHCAEATATGIADPPLDASEPFAVVITPTVASYVAADGTFAVTWVGEAVNKLKQVTLSLDGNPVDVINFAQASAPTSTIQTVVLSSTVEGPHTLLAQATDWNNRVQSTLFPVNFKLDLAEPSAVISTTMLTISDTYQLSSGIVRFHGQANDTLCLAAVQLSVDGGPFSDVNFNNGAWAAAYPVIEPEGGNLPATVRAIDCAGKITNIQRTVGSDLTSGTPPSTTITSGPTGKITVNSATFSFTGQAGSHEVTSFQCRIDDQPYAPCSAANQHTVTGLSENAHTFYVRAVDARGNVDETPASRSFFVNAIPLEVYLIDKPSDPTASHTVSFTFAGEDQSVTGYWCALNSGFTACTTPKNYAGLQSGDYTFEVRGRNEAFDVGPIVTYRFTVTNQAPLSEGQFITLDEDMTIPITLTASDGNDDPLTYTVIDSPTQGQLSGTSPALTYSPDADFNGSDRFTFLSNDGEVDSKLVTVTLTVLPVNDAPVVAGQQLQIEEEETISITLTGSDIDGDALGFSVVDAPQNGQLTGVAPDLTYTPDANFNGVDWLTFLTNDGEYDSQTMTVTINVGAVNDAPIADSQAITLDEDMPISITLTASDIDADPLSYSVAMTPTHGTLSGVTPELLYMPDGDFNGYDSFAFFVNDGEYDSETVTVTIAVGAVNDAPIADPQSVTLDEDTSIAITLSASDIDVDPLTFTLVTSPTEGEVSGVAPNLHYTPSSNFNGSDSFTFLANDGASDSSAVTVSITVRAINDAPIAAAQMFTLAEDTPISLTLTANDIDAEPLTYTLITTPTLGNVNGNVPDLGYLPHADMNGLDWLTFLVSDGEYSSEAMTVTLVVEPVNDAPVAESQAVTLAEDSSISITLHGNDIDTNLLTYQLVQTPTHGMLTGVSPNLHYTPAANYNGEDQLSFLVNDNEYDSQVVTVSIHIAAVNDAPDLTIPLIQLSEDGAISLTLPISDGDGDLVSYSILTPTQHGELKGLLPSLHYTPSANFHGDDSFTLLVDDGMKEEVTASAIDATSTIEVRIRVDKVNDAPVVHSKVITVNHGGSSAIHLDATDLDGDPLSYTLVEEPSHGQLQGTAPDLFYTADVGFGGSDVLRFRVNDGTVDSSIAQVTILVGNPTGLDEGDEPEVRFSTYLPMVAR